ncbi:MAG: YlbE-like family protein [Bacilli bacterium]
MRTDVWQLVSSKEEWITFIRLHPKWYRDLARDPWKFEQFEQDALAYNKQTVTDQVSKWKNGAQLASFMMDMVGNLK